MPEPQVMVFNPFRSKLAIEVTGVIEEHSTCTPVCIDEPGSVTPGIGQPGLIFVLLDQCCQQHPICPYFETFFSRFPLVPVVGIIDDKNKHFSCPELKKYVWNFITIPFSTADIVLNIEWYLSEQENILPPSISSVLKQTVEYDLLKGQSPALMEIKAQISRMASYDVTVLINGETGTGKELCARMIHFLRHGDSQPFVPVNCGALPEELLENELFGHHKGAYTHAFDTQAGLVKTAHGGTLFLDEIEALSECSQVKLLRFIEDKKFKPLGQANYLSSEVRFVAAAKEDLWELVLRHQFREDLYYRLNVVQIYLPPLRERCHDIPLLARHFLEHYSLVYEKPLKGICPPALLKLCHYDWPGNVRELENIIQEAVVNCDREWIESQHLHLEKRQKPDQVPMESFQTAKKRSIEAFEREYLKSLLSWCRGNISRAAKFAHKERSSFCRLLKKHHINADAFRR
jgi:DNA-binding NtrC family response regulator